MALCATIAVTLMMPNAIFNWEIVPATYGPNNDTEWGLRSAVRKNRALYPNLNYWYLMAGIFTISLSPVLLGLTMKVLHSVKEYSKGKNARQINKSITHLMILQALLIFVSTLPKAVNEFILIFGFRWIYQTTDWDRLIWWAIPVSYTIPAAFNALIYITFSHDFRSHLGQFLMGSILRVPPNSVVVGNPSSTIRSAWGSRGNKSNNKGSINGNNNSNNGNRNKSSSSNPVDVIVSPAPSIEKKEWVDVQA